MLTDLRFRLRALFRREVVEEELDQELNFHFENEVEKYRNAGMSREEATRRARLSFGQQSQIQEDCREARGTRLIETCLQDIRYGVLVHRNNPGFLIIAALTLGLGIGASTAVFSLVNTILLKPLPYPNAGRVVVAWHVPPTGSSWTTANFPWGGAEFALLTHKAKSFQNLAAFKKIGFNLTGLANAEHLEGVQASAGLFPALGIAPLLGRTFTVEEDRPGGAPVAVLSERLWKSHFAGDPGIVGKIIHLNGIGYTVIGVMPADFIFPNMAGMPPSVDLPRRTELWVPLALSQAFPLAPNDLAVIGELKPDIGMAQAQQDMQAYDRAWLDQHSQSKLWSSYAVPLTQQTSADTRRPLLLLFGAVSVVLLIACANVGGLTLNRALGRRREFTLRAALGARRSRMVGQIMTESLLLALVGGFVGILFAEFILILARRLGPDSIPHLHEAALDLRVVAFAFGISLLTGIVFGLAPTLGATRVNLVEALKEGTHRSGGSASAPRIRSLLLISQVGLAMVLVVSAGLLVRTFYHMIRSNSGFDATNVVTFELPLPPARYSDTDRIAQIYDQVLLRLQSIPGIKSVGFASVVPLAGPSDGTAIRVPGHPSTDAALSPVANYMFVSPGYFATIGTPLRGRDVADADTLTTVPVTIINRAMAHKYWPGQDPIGKQVGVAATTIPLRTIIGVVDDIKQVSLREVPDGAMFVPYTQSEMKAFPDMRDMQYAVRTKTDPASIASSIRLAVHSVDPDLPVANFATLTAVVDTSLTADRFAMLLLGAFGVLALALAAIGMYGVISYLVMQRTREIGVRIALGAGRTQILIMIIAQGCRLSFAGITVGLIGALITTRLMASFLYGVEPTDPITFATVALLLLAVALLACYVPARNAMKVDPMIALRCE